ncbi:hypothetical protein F5887DRAFT_1256654 [Amanita rubescens]|nr:hypothetical protein F5887DRAFT_1256654 [Amanita rubescens]
MQTSLPDLPFAGRGGIELDPSGFRSPAKSLRTHPRTDLQTLTPWISFPNDVHQAIQSATSRVDSPSTPFDIGGLTRTRFVANEKRLHTYVTFALHEPVEEVLKKLGVNGEFAPSGGNVAIIGDPDFSWVVRVAQPHPKLIVEYKTWWVVDVEHVVAAFNGSHDDTYSLHALEQIYGYMTFNHNKYGILTNWQCALFLQRIDHKTLGYYTIKLDRPDQPMSMLKAWVGMVLLAEDDWFYASPTPSGQNFGTSTAAWKERKRAVRDAQGYHMQPVDGDYQCVPLDFRLCHFDLSSIRHGENGCHVVKARLLASSVGKRDLHVVCKVVDVLRYPDEANLLDDEARAYAALQNLQGEAIPTLYGYYEVWGILRFLALEPVGNAIPEDEEIDPVLREKMMVALNCIHDGGHVHGDVARRNFCRTENGDIFLVDLERCRPSGNQSQMDDEMIVIEGL